MTNHPTCLSNPIRPRPTSPVMPAQPSSALPTIQPRPPQSDTTNRASSPLFFPSDNPSQTTYNPVRLSIPGLPGPLSPHTTTRPENYPIRTDYPVRSFSAPATTQPEPGHLRPIDNPSQVTFIPHRLPGPPPTRPTQFDSPYHASPSLSLRRAVSSQHLPHDKPPQANYDPIRLPVPPQTHSFRQPRTFLSVPKRLPVPPHPASRRQPVPNHL